MTAAQRSTRASLAAHALHASRDSTLITAPARKAFMQRFEREVDPTGSLPPQERERRAAHARRVFMLRLSLRSSKARASRNKNGSAPPAEPFREASLGTSKQPSVAG